MSALLGSSAMGSISQGMRAVGLDQQNALGLNDPETRAAAIPQIMSIMGDPRAANMDPGSIVSNDEDAETTMQAINKLLGKSKKTP